MALPSSISLRAHALYLGDGISNLLVGGDRSLVPAKFESNIRAAAIGGEVFVASLGVETNDIVGVAAWYGPGQASNAT